MSDPAGDRKSALILEALASGVQLLAWEIAEESGVSRDTIWKRMPGLIAAGYVLRHGNEKHGGADARSGFTITPAGRSALSSLPADLLARCHVRKMNRAQIGRKRPGS